MSSRVVLQQLIDSNVYDNNNKEILAAMLRDVFEGLMNGDFNKTDDQLQNIKYNATQTLAQVINGLPVVKKCTIGPFDVGADVSNLNIDVSGDLITDATLSIISAGESKIVINFSESIINKFFVFNYSVTNPSDASLSFQNDVLCPIYVINNTQRITVAMREIVANTQFLYLNILML